MSTGPTTDSPPSGPGRINIRELAAALAGDRGHSAVPLHPRRRLRNYWQQNGVEKLTDRQRRRAEHKAWRAVKTSADRPGAGAAGVDVAAPAHTAT